jgi:hypothetical protein
MPRLSASLPRMPRKPKPQPDDPAQSKRFIDMAREVEADDSEKGREAFERAFKKVATPNHQEDVRSRKTIAKS